MALFGSEELEPSDSLKPTLLDLARIDSLEIGESLTGELDSWRLVRYKSEYCLFLLNKYKSPMVTFVAKDLLITFLNRAK